MTSVTELKKSTSLLDISEGQVLHKISASSSVSSDCKIHNIPIDNIFPNPNQPRKVFDDNSLLKLADSIRRFGMVHPITVRMLCSGSSDPSYEIVMGERRYRAAALLKLDHVPCIIIKSDNKRCAELSIIENIQRADLNYFEQAYAISTLISVYRLTQEEVAVRLSVSQSYVANKLRLLKYSDTEREKLLMYSLSERHARALLRIPSTEVRLNAMEYIHRNDLNVASAENYIAHLLNDDKPVPCTSKRLVLKDIRVFYNTVDKAISIVKQAGINIVTDRRDEDDGSSVLIIRIPHASDVSRET